MLVRTVEDPHILDSRGMHCDVMVSRWVNWEQPTPGPEARFQAVRPAPGLCAALLLSPLETAIAGSRTGAERQRLDRRVHCSSDQGMRSTPPSGGAVTRPIISIFKRVLMNSEISPTMKSRQAGMITVRQVRMPALR